MATRYHVALCSALAAPDKWTALESVTRKRRDAAAFQAHRLAYEGLARDARLDTRVAHNALRKIRVWESEAAGLKAGVIIPCGPFYRVEITWESV